MSRYKLTLAGIPLHPLYKSIRPLLDDFILDHPFLKDCAPFVLARPHLITSSDYAMHPPPPALPLYVRSRLRGTPTPPQPATPDEHSPITTSTSKPGTEFFVNSVNATREAMEATGHAFVTIGASMDVRKWSWPGYLTFKGAPPKAASSSQGPPADVKNGEEGKPVDGTEGVADSDGVVGEDCVTPSLEEAGLPGDVDRESLHEAMSTDGREWRHEDDAPLGEENAPAVHSASQISEPTVAVDDATSQTESDTLQDAQASSPSSLASPSTPVIHPPDLTSSPSLSSSQSTLPVPVPAPSFRSFSLHFSPREDPLATARKRVLYMIVSVHLYDTSS